VSDEKPLKIIMFYANECDEIVQDALERQKLVSFLIKKYDTGNNHALFQKLCEYYMCNTGIEDLLEDMRANKEKYHNKDVKKSYYLISEETGVSLHLLLKAQTILEEDLMSHNISFLIN